MAKGQEPASEKVDWSQPPQEYFSDVFWTQISPWSASITFGLRLARPSEKDTPKIRMRMPLQQAKALAFLLLRAVRAYEDKFKVNIELPDDLLNELGIPLEDWKHFTK